MTPFGAKLRELRKERNVNLKEMAAGIGVTSAYLSALEHGNRGLPTFEMTQRMIAYLNIIWDEAHELQQLREISNPRVTVDTAGLAPAATEFANELSKEIHTLDQRTLEQMITLLRKTTLLYREIGGEARSIA